jgi:hypothetical protein
MDAWPLSTKIWCWTCVHEFNTVPVPVPHIYDERRQVFYVYGVFCSFSCAKRYIVDRNIASHQTTLLTLMRRKLLGSVASGPNAASYSVRAAPQKGALKVFGGTLSIEEYRSGGEVLEKRLSGVGLILTPRPGLTVDSNVAELGSTSTARISRTKVYKKDLAVAPKKRTVDEKASMRAIAKSQSVPNSTYKLRRNMGLHTAAPEGASLMSLLSPALQLEPDVE